MNIYKGNRGAELKTSVKQVELQVKEGAGKFTSDAQTTPLHCFYTCTHLASEVTKRKEPPCDKNNCDPLCRFILVQVKAKALVLAEMNSFLQRRTEEDEKVNRELEHTLQELQR